MTKQTPLVISNNATLRKQYHELSSGDIVSGRLRFLDSEEFLLLDLVERGVNLIPSGLSQLACRSKSFQATLFGCWMVDNTVAIHNLHQLMEAMQDYPDCPDGLVTKLDRKNAGLGIHRWNSLEEVFNQASLGVLPFPFVLQPFVPESRDIRVIVMDDYLEAYWRHNSKNFRNNLHFGGQSEPCTLKPEQIEICRTVMERGKFPYAHIDFMVTREGKSYLSEINLRGGIRGAQITPAEYEQRLQKSHQRQLEAALSQG